MEKWTRVACIIINHLNHEIQLGTLSIPFYKECTYLRIQTLKYLIWLAINLKIYDFRNAKVVPLDLYFKIHTYDYGFIWVTTYIRRVFYDQSRS